MKNDILIRTLTMQDAKKLAAPRPGKGWAVSFYLGVRARENYLAVANAFLSEEEKRMELSGDFSASDRARLHQVFIDMEQELRSRRLPDRTRTLALFFPARGRGTIHRLPVYVPTRLVVEKDWYLHPLLKGLEKYPRYAVVFLERDRARLFELFWGEVEQRSEPIRSEVPQRMNAARATWKGLEERKIQNHIEVHINRHLEKVARETEDFADAYHIPYLVIASRRELIERFRAFLPRRLRQRIVGAYLTRSDQALGEIKEKSLEVIAEFERAEEEKLIARLIAGSSKKSPEAALGADEVLRYLYDFKVHLLVIGKDFSAAGYTCISDHRALTFGAECGAGEATKSGDLVDEAIEAALEQGIGIAHFQFEQPVFDPYGLGAILK